MKNRLVFALFMLVSPFLVWGQTHSDTTFQKSRGDSGIIAFQVNYDQWGFMKDGEVIIPADYDEVGDFADGACAVRKGGFWGAINKKGDLIIPIEYEFVYYFDKGRTVAAKNDVYSLIDTLGNVLASGYNLIAYPSEEGSFIAQNMNEKYGAIDLHGGVSILFEYEFLASAGEGMIAFIENELMGYMNAQGEKVIPAIYEGGGAFQCGIASVKRPGQEKIGFIDIKGEEIELPKRFDYDEVSTPYVSKFSQANWKPNSYVASTSYGLRTPTGEIVQPAIYSSIYPFVDGYAVVHNDRFIGLVDSLGNTAVPLMYYGGNNFSEGMFAVYDTVTYKAGYVNPQNEVVIPFKYHFASAFNDGWAVVAKENKKEKRTYFIIDKKNKKQLKTKQYDYISSEGYSEGLIIVRKDGKYGAIDKQGKVIIPFEYEKLAAFKEGLASAKKNGKYGYINAQNEMVIDFQFDMTFNSFKNGIAVVAMGERLNYKEAMIDKNGKILTPFKYSSISEVYPDLGIYEVLYKAPVEDEPGYTVNQHGYVDRTGKEVVPAKYIGLYLINENEACVKQGDKFIRITLQRE